MKSLKILVVDDELSIRELFGEFLKINKHKVFLAKDGKEAIAKIDENRNGLDLVITDLNMPEAKGDVVIKFIKTFRPHIKTILMSAGDSETLKNIAESIGANCLLLKPMKLKDLEETIENLFG